MVKPTRTRPTFPALEWLDEASGRLPRIVLAGGRRAMIENHTGVIAFTEACVCVMTRQGAMSIEGRNLLLSEVRPDVLTVRGEIFEVRLPGAKGGGEDGR